MAAWFSGFPPTAWLTFPVLEFIANVALFVPAGVLWVLWTGPRRWWLALLVGLALSAGIETTQAVALPGRFPDARDLVANALGAALGAAAVAVAVRARRSRSARSRAGAGAASGSGSR